MAWRRLALTLAAGCLVSALGFQREFFEVVIPQRIPSGVTGNKDRLDYTITLQGTPYTIHLKQQLFLTNDFRLYTYSQGGLLKSTPTPIERDCYYQGYVADYADSLVMLSTCSGLRGLLQFRNISYGIEPIPAPGFQHLVYQKIYENENLEVSADNYSIRWSAMLDQKSSSGKPYYYLGPNEDAVIEKITQLINYIHTMFSKLNTRIVLSSLEFWTDSDKISTMGKVDKLLERFIEWKRSHLVLRPHDVAFLFVYRNQPTSIGATFARKMCFRSVSAGIAVYQKGFTLENFSVVVAQLLGFSLGIYFDNARDCHCSGSICLMHTTSVLSSGIKTFSSCSVKDFQSFLIHGEGQCLLNKPRVDTQYKASFCGNKVVEEGEQCDCGTERECRNSACCQSNCKLKPGKACAHGPCCWEKYCRLKLKGTLCRFTPEDECDLKEYCNGTSVECTEDFYVQDGTLCEGDTGTCMKGVCQSSDRSCRKIFGKDSKSGSSQCYEEINSQKDRMGHCGSSRKGYQSCQWQDLRCGKLVCEYPSNKPFVLDNAAIIYAKVQNSLCVTLDYLQGPAVKDPFLVHDGTGCGKDKVCMNQKCVDRAAVKPTCDASKNCNNRGMCNNKGNCHCNKGWAPPDCTKEEPGGLGGSVDSMFRSDPHMFKTSSNSIKTRNWLLLTFFLFLPTVVGSMFLIVKVRDFWIKKAEEDYSEEEEYETEGSQEANPSETASV